MIDNNLQKPIFFPFTDPFIQVIYNYNINNLEYLLKLCFFIGKPIYITAANLWQSKLSIELFNRARILFDLREEKCLGAIKLSTRNFENIDNVFSEYFNKRLNEREHFVNLPGELQLLDYQVPQTYLIAQQLDSIAKPFMRIGGDVTKVLSKNIQIYFNSNKIISSKLNEYIQNHDISRATIAHNIINSPYSGKVQEKLIMESNKQYYIANAIANQCTLVYPETRNNIILYNLSKDVNLNIIKVFNSIGLSYEKISDISYDALYVLEKCGVLDKFREYVLVNYTNVNKKITNNFNVIYFIMRFINRICSDRHYLKKLKESTQKISFEKDIFSEKTIFYCNLHHNLTHGVEKNMEEIKIPELIKECVDKFSLNDLKNICIEVIGDYEIFAHSNKIELARELCMECKRKNKCEELITTCIRTNSTFNLYSEDLFLKNSILDWKSSEENGKKLTLGRYEEIINRSYKFHSISFLETGLKMKKRICLLEIKEGDEGYCKATGFLINNEYIITNKHVIPYVEIMRDSVAWFDYEDTEKSNKFKCTLDYNNTYISDKYDIAITKLLKIDNKNYFDDLPDVNLGEAKLNDCIPIIQHANAMPKQICIGYNSLKYADNEILQYITNTLPGSSGAAIFDSNWNLIGIHSRGGELEPRSNDMLYRNEGISISCIKKFLEEHKIEFINRH
ncbi:MAG: serine protease [Clostridium sp.]|uniref:trypsin-like serine peptidase n=1 Tax=Clostridium sp. TaxID=1506 RepID=UPI002903B2A4|nr:serine protease [Clostridium sp.]MDU1603148.1 serine protease [Clostridium sp.]